MFGFLTYFRDRKRTAQFLDGLMSGFDTQMPGYMADPERPQDHKDMLKRMFATNTLEQRSIGVFVRRGIGDIGEIDKLVAEGLRFQIKRHPVTRAITLVDLGPEEGQPADPPAVRAVQHDDVMRALGTRDFRHKGLVLGRNWSPFFLIKLGQKLTPWWLKLYWQLKDMVAKSGPRTVGPSRSV